MPAVKIKDNEPFDVALRRFKRACEKLEFFLKFVVVSVTKSQQLCANERAAAVKRHLKKVSRETKKFERLY